MGKIKRFTFAVALLIVGSTFVIYGGSSNKLAKTEILGKEYYVYEVKKGESVYGVAKRYGWDLEELLRLNPDASKSTHKGMRLYYPTGQVSVVTEMPQPIEIDKSSLEPIRHKVKRGENVYSISRQYGVALETIYKQNPSAKKGVTPGETLVIPQSLNSPYYYYTVKTGDTLTGIARTFNTSVEDILRNNPGLTIDNLEAGSVLRISINSSVGKVKTELVAENKVSSINSYKVNKDETWEDISETTGVDAQILKEANGDEEKPKENTVVHVPVVEVVESERIIVPSVPEEMSEEEIKEMYDSIKGVSADDRIFEGVRMAVILDEPNTKKDIDFTRGILVALSQMEDEPYKVDLKVIDGRVSSNNLIEELDDFEPNLIVTTADKAFPAFLADYGNSNNLQVVNVFDLKNDLYEDNASMIQILAPSAYYNDKISNQIYKDNRRRKLYLVGEQDENDGIATELIKLYGGESEILTLEDFGNFQPDLLESFVIYSYASRKAEVSDFLKNVENLAANNPGSRYSIIGRSSWVAMLDDFGDQFQEFSVTIPSRVWLDEDSKEWKKFSEEYEGMFGGDPVRSIPSYAASGYDIANYFIPMMLKTGGDFNIDVTIDIPQLQNEINLNRVNNWGGFINGVEYLIEFSPEGKPVRRIVK